MMMNDLIQRIRKASDKEKTHSFGLAEKQEQEDSYLQVAAFDCAIEIAVREIKNTRPTDTVARIRDEILEAKKRYEAEKTLARKAVDAGNLSELQYDDVTRIAATQILEGLFRSSLIDRIQAESENDE